MQTRDIEANGLVFRAREHGEGVPVLLLHGFPETSIMWVPLMERLAAEGFHCLAPDQRGYSPGARPPDVEAYDYHHMAADIVGFLDAMGWQRAHLIGHDWGALAGWASVASYPERFLSWTSLSIPHIRPFGEAIRANDEQKAKSRYIDFFRQAGTAENALSANDFQALRGICSAHPQEEIGEYIAVLSQDGALTAALHWYRGSDGIRPTQSGGEQWGAVSTPTLHIWGNDDMAIGRDATEATKDHVSGPYRLLELDCGHWIVQEALDRIVEPIVAHLKQHS